MGPAADQPTRLIIEMRQFDLQAPLGGCRTLAKDLEDQTGAIDDLGFERLFEIALLDRAEARVEHDEPRLFHPNLCRKHFDLAAADQRGRLGLANTVGDPFDDLDADRGGKTRGLLQACVDVARSVALVRKDDDRARAARELVPIAFETATQSSWSASSASSASSVSVGSSARFSGRAG